MTILAVLVLAAGAQAAEGGSTGTAPPGPSPEGGSTQVTGTEGSPPNQEHQTPAGSGGEGPSPSKEAPPAGGQEQAAEKPAEHQVEAGKEGGSAPPNGEHPTEGSKSEPSPQPPGGEHVAEAPRGALTGSAPEKTSAGAPKGSSSVPGGERAAESPAVTPASPPHSSIAPTATLTAAAAIAATAHEKPVALTVSLAGPFTLGGVDQGDQPTGYVGSLWAGAGAGPRAQPIVGAPCRSAGHPDGVCAGGLVDPSTSSGSPVGLADGGPSLAVAPTGGPPPLDGVHGGAAVGNDPVGPAPGPAPSGASGSVGGASGLALSTFLTLAGLLLMGAPRAMRRLRLSSRPWRTAYFVLIPERPG